MSNNQKIDGVLASRELIEKAMQACFEAGHGITHDELHALLNAPFTVELDGQREPMAWSYKERVYASGIGYVWRDKIEREFPDTGSAEVKDLTALYARQSAQVGVNENTNFNAWREDQISALIRMGYPDAAKAFRDLGSVQWAGWQARANLSALVAERQAMEIIGRARTFVAFVAKCVRKNGEYAPLHRQEMEELDRDLKLYACLDKVKELNPQR